MKKILFISNTANFAKFNRHFMKWCFEQGWQVDYCAPDDEHITDYCNEHIVLSIPRNPFHVIQLYKCVKQLKAIINKEQYDIVHCHSPAGGVLGRLASRIARKKIGTKVIYTAHGFHFFHGVRLINWLVYYPVEWILSFITDILITINLEDYQRAIKHMHSKEIYKFDGIGCNPDVFSPVRSREEKQDLRAWGHFDRSSFILLYTAEFIPRKNHALLFKILPELKQKIPNLHLVLAGKGELLEYYKNYAQSHNMADYVSFIGYTNDMQYYCKISDVLVMPSHQEGLPISMVEAVLTGLPVVASNIRGHVDIISDYKNGYLCNIKKPKSFVDAIYRLYTHPALCRALTGYNKDFAEKYSVDVAVEKMGYIYNSCIYAYKDLHPDTRKDDPEYVYKVSVLQPVFN